MHMFAEHQQTNDSHAQIEKVLYCHQCPMPFEGINALTVKL